MSIQDRIESLYLELTPSQKKIARYIENHPEEVIFAAVADLAAEIGVSPATIVRFCTVLGCEGFPDLKQQLRQEGLALLAEAAASQGDGLLEASASEAASAEEMGVDLLQSFAASFDRDQMARLADAIMSADQVLLIGYLHSFSTAAGLLHELSTIRERVFFTRLLYGDDEAMSTLLDDEIAVNTLVIVVSFEPHYRYTQRLTRRASEGNRRIFVLSDAKLNPLTEFAEEVVVLPARKSRDGGAVDTAAAAEYVFQLSSHIRSHYADRMRDQEISKKYYLE